MFGSGLVEIIDSNPHTDRRLGENMLPPALKAAYDRGADLTRCIVEAGTSTYDNNWYAFHIVPKNIVRRESNGLTTSGRWLKRLLPGGS
jgi:hypothetical protein